MPPWGCDREQGGSAPNAVKRYKRKELAETLGYFGEPLILPSCNSLEGRQLLTFLNLNPIFALLNGRPATAYRSSKYLLTVCARQSRAPTALATLGESVETPRLWLETIIQGGEWRHGR